MKKLLVLALLPLSVSAFANCDGDVEVCENLRPDVEVVQKRTTPNRVYSNCGYGNHACAKITQTTCKVYYKYGHTSDDLLHELNHCRGWDHREVETSTSTKLTTGLDVNYEWFPAVYPWDETGEVQ